MDTLRVQDFFRASFGASPARVIRAPGRLELLGNHTDYNGGLVMALAVDRFIDLAVSPRKDAQVEVVTTAFDHRERFYLDRIAPNPAAPWANYIKGVLLQLQACGVHFTGFNAAIHGTIPLGAGLSSSAALEIATLLAVREMFPFRLLENSLDTPPRRENGRLPPLSRLEKLRLAQLGRDAESQFVGVHCGLLDQVSCLFGKAGHVVQFDCLHHAVQHDPLPPGAVFIVVDSGTKHDLAAGAYNQLRELCDHAARKLGVRFLRSIDLPALEKAKSRLTPREYQCAFHIVGENQRVVFAERALREGDLDQLGQYLLQSHASSRDDFQNSTPELDLLVDLARNLDGCFGARLTGGGFGGATINLVAENAAAQFMAQIADNYRAQTGISSHPWIARIVGGAE